MIRILVWDLPVRVFHWTLVGCFFTALGLAQFAPEHSSSFDMHMLLGLVLAPILLFRILWGFVGTRYARFSSFLFGPNEVVEYLRGIVTRKGKRYIGHNPGSSYAIFAMLALVLGIVTTGLLLQRGEIFEELHGMLAYIAFAVILMHVVGVILHTIRYRENIVISMWSGSKEAQKDDAISSSKPIIALALLLIIGTWTTCLVSGYDQRRRCVDLPFVGKAIQLGESNQFESSPHNDDDD